MEVGAEGADVTCGVVLGRGHGRGRVGAPESRVQGSSNKSKASLKRASLPSRVFSSPTEEARGSPLYLIIFSAQMAKVSTSK